jgi:tetratricopeptide (TPR) repeat protein
MSVNFRNSFIVSLVFLSLSGAAMANRDVYSGAYKAWTSGNAKQLGAATAKHAENAQVALLAALAARVENNSASATELLGKAAAGSGEASEVAKTILAAGQPESADAALVRLESLAKKSKDAVVWHFLAVTALDLGNTELAHNAFRKVLGNPGARAGYADTLEAEGLWWDAHGHRTKVADNAPTAQNLQKLATNLLHLRRYSESLTLADKVVALAPESPSGYVARARSMQAMHQLEAAAGQYEKATQVASALPRGWVDGPAAVMEWASCLEQLNKYADALSVYRKVAALNTAEASVIKEASSRVRVLALSVEGK